MMEINRDQLRETIKKWEKQHKQEFEKERKKEFTTGSGIPMNRVYTPADLDEKGVNYFSEIGLPGEYPYTRGINASGYRGELWKQRQASGRATAKESNKLYKSLIASGFQDLQIAYDVPTQLGYSPDDPEAEGEVGRMGLSMCSLRDWEETFEGLDLSKFRVSQAINATAAFAIACYLALAEKRGISFSQLAGVVQNDVLKEYLARGLYIFPPRPALRLLVDSVAYCQEVGLRKFYPLYVCGYQFGERGATPVHEAGCAMALLFTYVQAFSERGLDIDSILQNIEYLSPVYHFGFFEDIAKHRALRKVYAKVLKEKFGVKNQDALKLQIYCGTGGSGLYREQYLNNIARVTISGVISALSGCQIMRLTPYDEAYGLPSVEAATNSLRTMQIIGHETDIVNVVDPLGGSYFVEWLTSMTEKEILKTIQNIEESGGVIRAIEEGSIMRMLNIDAYEKQKAFEKGDLIRVGVNKFRDEGGEEKSPKVYYADPKVQEQRIKEVRDLKKNRDNTAVEKALRRLKTLAGKDATAENNLMPAIMDAVKAYATLGETFGVLRDAWGMFREPGL